MKLWSLFLASVLLLIAKFTLGEGSELDHLFGSMRWVGMASMFLFWSMGVLGWGRFLSFRLQESSIGLSAAFGTAFAALFACVLGHLHFIGPGSQPAFILAVFMGVALQPPFHRPFQLFGLPESRAGRVSLVVLGTVLFLRAFGALHLNGNPDPLWYHLGSARLWADQGAITRLPPSIPDLMHACYWDYIYIGVIRLCSGAPGQGLIEAQILSQLIHYFFGYVGSVLLSYTLARRLSLASEWAILAALACATTLELSWVSVLAKNDWGMILWTLAAFFYLPGLLPQRRSPHALDPWIAGAFAGFAVAAKLNAIVAVFFSFLVSFIFKRWKIPWRLWMGFVLAAAPIFIRNWVYTRNPLYPEANWIFHSPFLSPSYGAKMEFVFNVSFFTHFDNFLFRVEHLLWSRRLLTGMLGLALVTPMRSEMRRKLRPWVLATLLSTLFFSVKEHGLELRHFGPGLVMIQIASVACVYSAAAFYFKEKPSRSFAAWLVCFGVVVYLSDLFRPGFYNTPQLFQEPSGFLNAENLGLQILHEPMAGESKAWIRAHTHAGQKILTTGENQTYYLPGLLVVPGNDDPELDPKLIEAEKTSSESGDKLIQTVVGTGAVYVLDTFHFSGGYWSHFARSMDLLVRHYPDVVVYGDHTSRVISIEALAKHLPIE